MTAFYENANAATFSGQHQRNVAQRMKPWARARTPAIDLSLSGQSVVGASAVGTVVGTASASGGKAPYVITISSDASAKLTIAANVLKIGVSPIAAATYNVVLLATDAAGNTQTETFGIKVT